MGLVHTVLISGKQGSGKTTLANQLSKMFMNRAGWRCVVINFADTLYKIHDFARGTIESHGIPRPDTLAAKDGPLLQYLGTDWGRKTYGDDVWVQLLKNQMQELTERLNGAFDHLVFVIPDCRFQNEFAAFPNATRIRLECDRETRKERVSMWRENDTHQSEIDLDELDEDSFDFVFDTAGYPPESIAETIMHRLETTTLAEKELEV